MELKKLQSLTFEKVTSLRDRAKAGNSRAVSDFVRFSIWRKIDNVENLSKEEKGKAYHEIMSKIKIKVENNA